MFDAPVETNPSSPCTLKQTSFNNDHHLNSDRFFFLRYFPNLTETGLLGAGLIGQAFGVIDQGLGLLLGKGHEAVS